MTKAKTISIILVDDHKILRDGMRSLLEGEPEFVIIGEAENGEDAVRLARDMQPDVIVMDVSLPDMNGIEATRQILAESPDISILALSAYSEKQFILEMLKAGAHGYLLKDCAFEELLGAVRTVASKEMYIAHKVLATVVSDLLIHNTTGASHSDTHELTPREREILRLIAKGHCTKTIAAELEISVKTVDTHRQNIMEKLNIHNIADLTRYAIQTGLIPLNT